MYKQAEELFSKMPEVQDGKFDASLCAEILGKIVYEMIKDVVAFSEFIAIPAKDSNTDIDKAYMCMRTIKGDEFKKQYAKGLWPGVNPYLSQYRGHIIALKDSNRDLYHNLYCDPSIEAYIASETNKGRRYG